MSDDTIGKVRPELLKTITTRTGAADDAVLQGPAYGEDTAAIRLGEEILVVNSDPISLAVERIGILGVTVVTNDIAASGGRPRWLTVTIFVPDDDPLDEITRQLDETATNLGVSIVGGHTEYAPEASRPTLSLTCFGLTDTYVPTGGAEPGDRLVLTKGAGIEGTAILATDFRTALADAVPDAVFDRAADFFDDVSILPEAERLTPHATAMHDPTEGGVLDGLLEMAVASDVAVDVTREAIPIREETETLCAAAGVDPLRIFGSGALLASLPADDADEAVAALRDDGIDAAVVGRVVDAPSPELRLDGESYREAVRDEMYALWE